MNSRQLIPSLTAITVVSDGAVPADVLTALSRRLAELSEHSEVVVIANGVGAKTAQLLRELLASAPDITVHFLADNTDRDVATLVGMDRSLGDWVVVTTPTMGEVDALPRLLAATKNHEVVFAGPPASSAGGAYALLGRLFFRVSGWLAGAPLDWPTPRLRAYSRAACRWLCTRLDGAVLMRSLAFRGSFPGHMVTAPELAAEQRRSTMRESLFRALRHLGRASTLPLRLAIGLAVGGILAGLAAMAYVVTVYATHGSVQPGWTTLAALLGVMMVVFSALFALLTSYILAMYSSIQPRSRVPVVRELRSAAGRLERSLDIAGDLAPPTFGAPPDVMADIGRTSGTR
jgi:hypothetical protein